MRGRAQTNVQHISDKLPLHQERFGRRNSGITIMANYGDQQRRLFSLRPAVARGFLDESWELLGRYITNNTHLTDLCLSYFRGGLSDRKMLILFNNLVVSSSLKRLDLSWNEFGLNGVQSMVLFLRNSPNLTLLNLYNNHNIDTDCFRLIVEALDGSSVERLNFGCCGISDITALANCDLPHLKEIYFRENSICRIPSLENYTSLESLDVGKNKIGNAGCREFAKLLANNSSSLDQMKLHHNAISNEGAEIIADSLKHNTTLRRLILNANNHRKRMGSIPQASEQCIIYRGGIWPITP